jgi:protein involved in ribonucleotide reduction
VIYYSSLTGNTRRFVKKTGLPAVEIKRGIKAIEPFVIVTYTIGFGQVPQIVDEFLKQNGDLLRGVAVSGNRNWGDSYGKAGDIIANKYDVPLLLKFELAGADDDVKTFKERVVKCGISN